MLKENDEEWLRHRYPALIRAGQTIAGTIQFKASYNQKTNRFVILDDQATDQIGSVALAGTFQIRIEERTDKSISRLPAVYVERLDPISDRHFNPRDKTACLCSPLEEDEFLQPALQFRAFLEQLVIPFLYGQLSYSSTGRWPWKEYSHGASGILESYSQIRDRNQAEECVRKLALDSNWPRIQSALRQKPYVKGHTPCFCPRMDQIRRCHPGALQGELHLQRDLRELGIPIP